MVADSSQSLDSIVTPLKTKSAISRSNSLEMKAKQASLGESVRLSHLRKILISTNPFSQWKKICT